MNGRKRKVEFETDALVQGRIPFSLTMAKRFMARTTTLREGFIVPWEAVYHTGAKIAARARSRLELV